MQPFDLTNIFSQSPATSLNQGSSVLTSYKNNCFKCFFFSRVDNIWNDLAAPIHKYPCGIVWKDLKTLQLDMPGLYESFMLTLFGKEVMWKRGWLNVEVRCLGERTFHHMSIVKKCEQDPNFKKSVKIMSAS